MVWPRYGVRLVETAGRAALGVGTCCRGSVALYRTREAKRRLFNLQGIQVIQLPVARSFAWKVLSSSGSLSSAEVVPLLKAIRDRGRELPCCNSDLRASSKVFHHTFFCVQRTVGGFLCVCLGLGFFC